MPHQKTYKVNAGGFEFTFSDTDIDKADMVSHRLGEYNLLQNHRSAKINLLNEVHEKRLHLEVDGEPFDVQIKDELDQMLDSMGYNASSGKQQKDIKAPMPGLVINIAVQEGQQVNEGDRILILEAMKMENSIMVHGDATIKKINVKAGQAVDKGQVLVELE